MVDRQTEEDEKNTTINFENEMRNEERNEIEKKEERKLEKIFSIAFFRSPFSPVSCIGREKERDIKSNAFRFCSIEVQLICAIGRRSEKGHSKDPERPRIVCVCVCVWVQYQQQLKHNTHQWI